MDWTVARTARQLFVHPNAESVSFIRTKQETGFAAHNEHNTPHCRESDRRQSAAHTKFHLVGLTARYAVWCRWGMGGGGGGDGVGGGRRGVGQVSR